VNQEIGKTESGRAPLLMPRQLTGTAQLEVGFRYFETIVCPAKDIQPPPCGFRRLGVHHEHAPGRSISPSNPATELVQLGQPEAIGPFDHHHRCLGDIDPYLHNRCRQQDLDLTVAEATGHRFSSLTGHSAVDHPDSGGFQLRSNFGSSRLEGRRGRTFTGVDFRKHHKDPTAVRDFLPQEFVQLRHRRQLPHDGRHRLPSGRQLVDDRNIQISVNRQGQRPRDRCRRHHQHVGCPPLATQGFPLAHSESMLFIHNRQPQILEFNAALDKCVRSHHEPHRAVGETRSDTGPIARRRGQQVDIEGRVFKERRHRPGVLFGEEFGGRHQGRLVAALQHQPKRKRCDHRLAATHITLDQPGHGMRTIEIARHLIDDTLLGCGQFKGHHLPRPLSSRISSHTHRRHLARSVVPVLRQSTGKRQ